MKLNYVPPNMFGGYPGGAYSLGQALQDSHEEEQERARQREKEERELQQLRYRTFMDMSQNPQAQQQDQQGGGVPNIGGLTDLFGGSLGGAAGAEGGKTSAVAGLGAKNVAGGAAGGGGFGSTVSAAGPWALLAAAILGQENYQQNIGNRDDEAFPYETAITGRALYKDAPGWGEKADDIIPGLGSPIRIAGLTSSPVDMFRGDTYKDLWKEAKGGGLLGGLFKGLF